VVRNRIRRRIHAICAGSLSLVPSTDLIVVRVLPGAHEASWDTLRTEIGDGLRRAVTAS
jgi:ribonuclease P protein component